MLRRFLKFGLVGTAGFIVDACVLSLLQPWLGPYGSRLLSFFCAVTTTFALNRRFVFHNPRQGRAIKQFFAFVSANLVGAALNLGIYSLLLASQTTDNTLIALALGSVAGWVANFLLSDRLVFTASTHMDKS